MSEVSDERAITLIGVPVEKIYDDLFHPLLSEVGKSAGNIASIMTEGANLWATDKKEMLQTYFERKKIAREKLQAPAPEIAVPAILAMSYVSKEALKEMYTNLLGSSMNVDTADFVHPSFVSIISQLLPDEAKVLKELPRRGLDEPLVDILVEKPGADGSFLVHRNCGVLGFEAGCDIPENLPIYLDNLLRLSLVSIPESRCLADTWRYDKIISSEHYQKLAAEAEATGLVSWEPRMVGLTDYGAQFRDICLS